MPTDMEKLKSALLGKTDDEVEEIRQTIIEEIERRNRDRAFHNKHLVRGTPVEIVKRSNKIPLGAKGTFVEARRTRGTIDIDGKIWTMPLSMFRALDA